MTENTRASRKPPPHESATNGADTGELSEDELNSGAGGIPITKSNDGASP